LPIRDLDIGWNNVAAGKVDIVSRNKLIGWYRTPKAVSKVIGIDC
jgi:hypothetical protein